MFSYVAVAQNGSQGVITFLRFFNWFCNCKQENFLCGLVTNMRSSTQILHPTKKKCDTNFQSLINRRVLHYPYNDGCKSSMSLCTRSTHTITYHVPIPGGKVRPTTVALSSGDVTQNPRHVTRDSNPPEWCKEVESTLTWPEKTFPSSCGRVLL